MKGLDNSTPGELLQTFSLLSWRLAALPFSLFSPPFSSSSRHHPTILLRSPSCFLLSLSLSFAYPSQLLSSLSSPFTLPRHSHQLSNDSLTKCRFPSFPWQRSVFLLTPLVPLPSASRSRVRARPACLSFFLLPFAVVLHGTDRNSLFPPRYFLFHLPNPGPPRCVTPDELACVRTRNLTIVTHRRKRTLLSDPGNPTYRARQGFNLHANLKPVRLITDSYHFSRQLFPFSIHSFVFPYRDLLSQISALETALTNNYPVSRKPNEIIQRTSAFFRFSTHVFRSPLSNLSHNSSIGFFKYIYIYIFFDIFWNIYSDYIRKISVLFSSIIIKMSTYNKSVQ